MTPNNNCEVPFAILDNIFTISGDSGVDIFKGKALFIIKFLN